jgi:flagellar biosynthesis GTPase FlhF
MPDVDPEKTGTDPQYFTAADLEKARREAIEQARKEERDKLYSQRDKQKEAFDAMQAEVAELRKAEVGRQKVAEKLAADAEKAKKAQEDAELSAKDLLAKREQTWQQQLDQMKADQDARMAEIAAQREVDKALMAKEREMQALQIYIRDAATASADKIAPELIDLINGNTTEEVDRSVADLIARTEKIVEGMRQATLSQRAGMPGVSPSGGATAVVSGIDTGDKVLTADDIKNMSMQEFAALRQKTGLSGAGTGRGIFG